jgi:hypothetical protein
MIGPDATGDCRDAASDTDGSDGGRGNPDGSPDSTDADSRDTSGDGPDPTEAGSCGTDGHDPDAVRRAIRDRAREIECRERSRALDRLEAHGEVTAEQRRVIGELASGIVDGILAGPESALGEASAADTGTVRTAAALFDPDHGDGE